MMGYVIIYPRKNKMGDPVGETIVLGDLRPKDLHNESENEEYKGEADSRQIDHRGFNK